MKWTVIDRLEVVNDKVVNTSLGIMDCDKESEFMSLYPNTFIDWVNQNYEDLSDGTLSSKDKIIEDGGYIVMGCCTSFPPDGLTEITDLQNLT